MVIVILCLLTASCGDSITKSPKTTTLHLEKVAIPNTKQTEGKWQIPYNKAKELIDTGNLTEASYYLSNALGTSPGNFTVIDAYCKTMFAIGRTKNGEIDIAVLQVLESFLQSQVPLVQVDDVSKLLLILKKIRKEIETQNAKIDTDPQDTETQNEKDIAKSQFDTLIKLLEERKKSVNESCKTSPAIAEYQLQECEQCLRGLVALQTTENSTVIKNEINELKELAKKVIEIKSNEIWQETNEKIEKKLEQHKYNKASKKKESITALQEAAELLQKVFPLLSEQSLKEAEAKREYLNDLSTKYNIELNQKYNEWALNHIKKCLQNAYKAQGYITNGSGRVDIGKALIEELGPIDRRFLTSEVSRCYDEVLNKFLSERNLNPVKNEKSIEEPGNILHTLNEMYKVQKIQLLDEL
jgi:hypothetical protein